MDLYDSSQLAAARTNLSPE